MVKLSGRLTCALSPPPPAAMSTLKSDLRATLQQLPRPRLAALKKARPEFGQSALWWDSFDETAEFEDDEEEQPAVTADATAALREIQTDWGAFCGGVVNFIIDFHSDRHRCTAAVHGNFKLADEIAYLKKHTLFLGASSHHCDNLKLRMINFVKLDVGSHCCPCTGTLNLTIHFSFSIKILCFIRYRYLKRLLFILFCDVTDVLTE